MSDILRGSKRYFDMGRGSIKYGESIIPLKQDKVIFGIDSAKGKSQTFTINIQPFDLDMDRFREMWEEAIGNSFSRPILLEEGMKIERREFKSGFRPIDKDGNFIDPPVITPYGKNLYRRKLRIRR